MPAGRRHAAKHASPEALVEAMRTVAGGDGLTAPSVARRLIAEFARTPAAPQRPPKGLEELTERERDVLELVARGRSNAEIARELMVGAATVKTHVTHVLTKLGLRDRVQAVIYAYEAGRGPARLDLSLPAVAAVAVATGLAGASRAAT